MRLFDVLCVYSVYLHRFQKKYDYENKKIIDDVAGNGLCIHDQLR